MEGKGSFIGMSCNIQLARVKRAGNVDSCDACSVYVTSVVQLSSRGGLEVERWSNNKLDSAWVIQFRLGTFIWYKF